MFSSPFSRFPSCPYLLRKTPVSLPSLPRRTWESNYPGNSPYVLSRPRMGQRRIWVSPCLQPFFALSVPLSLHPPAKFSLSLGFPLSTPLPSYTPFPGRSRASPSLLHKYGDGNWVYGIKGLWHVRNKDVEGDLLDAKEERELLSSLILNSSFPIVTSSYLLLLPVPLDVSSPSSSTHPTCF